MTHEFFSFGARLTERTPEFVRKKIRIVAEPVCSTRKIYDGPANLTATREFGSSVDERSGTDVGGRSILDAVQRSE
jgi:hypothetical protein